LGDGLHPGIGEYSARSACARLWCVWTAAYADKDRMKSVREILSIPENIIPLNVIPVGVPANKNEKPKDKFREENIHWDKW